MDFDKNKVITGLNAEKVSIGSQGYFSYNILGLKNQVENNELISMYMGQNAEGYLFDDNNECYPFFYLVKKNSKRSMTFEEIFEWWDKFRNSIITFENGNKTKKGLIQFFDFNKKIINVCGEDLTVKDFVTYCTAEDNSNFEVIDE